LKLSFTSPRFLICRLPKPIRLFFLSQSAKLPLLLIQAERFSVAFFQFPVHCVPAPKGGESLGSLVIQRHAALLFPTTHERSYNLPGSSSQVRTSYVILILFLPFSRFGFKACHHLPAPSNSFFLFRSFFWLLRHPPGFFKLYNHFQRFFTSLRSPSLFFLTRAS